MAIHAGWKGYSQNIISKGLNLFKKLQTDAAPLKVFIGPAISRESFEIGPEVLETIRSSKVTSEDELLICSEKGTSDRWHFDLQQAACLFLLSQNVDAKRISVIRECTVLNEKWHSYRREKQLCGHNYTIVEKVE